LRLNKVNGILEYNNNLYNTCTSANEKILLYYKFDSSYLNKKIYFIKYFNSKQKWYVICNKGSQHEYVRKPHG